MTGSTFLAVVERRGSCARGYTSVGLRLKSTGQIGVAFPEFGIHKELSWPYPRKKQERDGLLVACALAAF